MHILILPGWRQYSEHWKIVSSILASQNVTHDVLDLPGFGNEPAQDTLTNASEVAKWVTQYITTHVPNTDIVLVGHSYGGRVAAHIAASKLDYIKGLVLIGSPNIYRPSIKVQCLKLLTKVLHPVIALAPENFRSTFRSSDYTNVKGTPLETLYSNIIVEDQTRMLQTLSLPTHLIWGENDTQAPLSSAKEMCQLIPNASLEIITATGHDVHIEKPHLLTAKILSYVKTL
ncbi:MAG: pimeloyl-ACP methyl ester carboxylesterase [Candidatus Azotimanducaceae bacterium]|jgi:pimeloyl-ACP methyl ester carboxylesterase